MLNKLSDEQQHLERASATLSDKKTELQRILAAAPSDAQLDIDTAIEAKMPLHRQLLKHFLEDNTIEDSIYYLGEALKKSDQLNLDTYLKHVRKLSRKQFYARATMRKCRAKAGLSL